MSNKMNVLFIITDQQRADMLSCSGNEVIKTPNLDRLAKESVRFSNAFCTCPMCMPNRATLLTGYYPNVHGVRSNGINLPQNIPTVTNTLVNRGYHTISIGKTHFNTWTPRYDPKTKSAEDFQDWKVKNPKGDYLTHERFPIPYYGFKEVDLVIGHGNACSGHYLEWIEERDPKLAEKIIWEYSTKVPALEVFYESWVPLELYNTTYIQNNTISFLERYAKGNYGEKPFFLHCSFPDPHQPVSPPNKYRDMYKPEDMVLPENIHNIKNLYKHPYLKKHLEHPPVRDAMLREESEENIRKFIALSYGSVSLIDYAVGQILASLEKFDLVDNTMVIFTSDHGDYMGDHGLILKGISPFNGTLQVPLIWKVPGVTKPAVSDTLFSSIDIPKTILELLKIKEKYRPPGMQGYDMTPILKDPKKELRDCILIMEDEEVGPRGPLYTRLIHLVTKNYKLTKYAELPGYGDLFDRNNDKLELNNLWEKDQSLRLELLDKMFHEYSLTRSRFPKRDSGF
ncbi:MAG: sulfatase [Candidatus Hermodarchaeota archaeon]